MLCVRVAPNLARELAQVVAAIIHERQAEGRRAVLGLPTGSTPVGMYRELIRMHRAAQLDLSNVVTFNLDEYYGLAPDRLQSYHRWMFEHFFDHVNIPRENIHIPDGQVPPDQVSDHCRQYEDGDPRGRRHRHPTVGHRPQRAHRFQRAVLARA